VAAAVVAGGGLAGGVSGFGFDVAVVVVAFVDAVAELGDEASDGLKILVGGHAAPSMS
jgi:hypothetical protein